MIDTIAARTSYTRYEINAIGLEKGFFNPVGDLAKIKGNGTMSCILHQGISITPTEQ